MKRINIDEARSRMSVDQSFHYDVESDWKGVRIA
jgi:hypothetical protein